MPADDCVLQMLLKLGGLITQERYLRFAYWDNRTLDWSTDYGLSGIVDKSCFPPVPIVHVTWGQDRSEVNLHTPTARSAECSLSLFCGSAF